MYEKLIDELEQDQSLYETDRLHGRIEALDLLDSYLADGQVADQREESAETELQQRAKAIYARLEAANARFYEAIRSETRQGVRPELLRWMSGEGSVISPPSGEGYDYLDDLVSGILQFNRPSGSLSELPEEMVLFQPTPARHIFDLLRRTELTDEDVLVDLGAGLGHLPLLTAICTEAHSVGIELDAAYVDCARRSADALNLNRAIFLQQDARVTDFSHGTVFYLYTPFGGSVLRSVLSSLRQQASSREIRICTYGPCTLVIAREPWLQADRSLATDQVAIFRSH